VGVIDVPGHIDFIKNMLAGVGGIDAVLLVIAADEGVMPQTREHLAILDLLEIPAGVIVITKVDLIEDHDWLELVQADIAETVARTVLADAPMVPVSAVSGRGLDTLLETVAQLLKQAPPRVNRGRPRLPIDRVFSISGFGTVVTGTLLDGQLEVGQEVEILPAGLRSRIRGLQAHKQAVEWAEPGSRTAVNLTGLSTADLFRGNVLTTPGWLEPSQLIDVYCRLLPDSPKPLRHNQAVEVFTGAVEVAGFTRLLGVRQLEPGQTGWLQLRLVERIPVVKGDHFIIRQPSPSLTIGGGVVVDPLPRRRHRRFRPELIKRLETLRSGTPEDVLLAELDRQGPLPVKTLLTEGGLPAKVAAAALDNLLDRDEVLILSEPEAGAAIDWSRSKFLIASRAGWATFANRIGATLANYHQRFPLRMGMPRSELKSRLKLETRLFNEAIQRAEQENMIGSTETALFLSGHQVNFSPAQQENIEKILAKFRSAPYSTPSPKEVADSLGEDVLQALVEGRQLIRLSAEVLLLATTYEEFVAWLKRYLQANKSVNVAQVRDTFATSRKYALALLEYTDEQRLTKRVGDERVLRLS
jgi:selenocysteine-specific elongation factor